MGRKGNALLLFNSLILSWKYCPNYLLLPLIVCEGYLPKFINILKVWHIYILYQALKQQQKKDFIFWMCKFSLPCDQEVRFRHWPNDPWDMFHFFFSQWKEKRFVREVDKHENVLLLLTLQTGFLLNITGLAVVSKVSWMLYTGPGCHLYVVMPCLRTKVYLW